MDDAERPRIGVVDADFVAGKPVLDQLIFDAFIRERAGRVEAERLHVARQDLHRRDAAGLDRGVTYTTLTDPTTLPTGASATYDTAGELTSSTKGSTTTAFSYDSIGARTKAAPSTGPTTTLGYNALGQMTSAKSTAATGPLSGTGVGFTYGATGIPVGKTTNTGTMSTLVWDTTGADPELLADGTTAFLYGPNGEVVEQVNLSTTAPTYLVGDQLGSTRLLTDQAGTVTGTYSYGPYGDVTSHTGTATTLIGYAGGFATATTGLVNFDHRWLTTGTASWLTVDPLVATTTAPYTYATNDPTNEVDPSGEFGITNPLHGVCVGFIWPAACAGNLQPSPTPGKYTEFDPITGTDAYCQLTCGTPHPKAYVLTRVVTYWNGLNSSARPTENSFTTMLHMVVNTYTGTCGGSFRACVNGFYRTATLRDYHFITTNNSVNWWAIQIKEIVVTGGILLKLATWLNTLGSLVTQPSRLGSYTFPGAPCQLGATRGILV